MVLKRTPIGAPRTSASFTLNYKALSPFASMVQVGNFTALQTLEVDVHCFNTVVYSYTIDIIVRDRKPHLIGWSMRITFDVTRRLHFPCIFRVRVLCSPYFKAYPHWETGLNPGWIKTRLTRVELG